MTSLYITSLSEHSGKTMLSAGLGKNWLDSGKKVGYLKLVTSDQTELDKEVLFIQKLFGLTEPVDTLTVMADESGSTVQTALTRMQDKDIVIIEGLPLKVSGTIIRNLNARVLVVHDYALSLSEALPEYKKISNFLVGVVLNKVPRNKVERLSSAFKTELSSIDINFLGSIPEDRVLMSLSVGDLAEVLKGKILNSAEKSSDLIENIMMGSSTFDRGAAYYNRKNNKAVILWGERPGFRKAAMSNLQLAALQTSSRCLVVSAGAAPVPAVLQKANEQKVPVISAPGSIPDIVSALENPIGGLRFNQEQKIPRLLEIMRANLDIAKLLTSITSEKLDSKRGF
jgi:BioD-like phosphotransacetylase family protein